MIDSSLSDYLPQDDGRNACQQLSTAEDIGVVNILFYVVKEKRKFLREQNENNPKRTPENLTTDMVFQAGMINALNWILDLPESARELLKGD